MYCPRDGGRLRIHLPLVDAVIFVGIQAAGKTTFFRERFAGTHAHVNLDTQKTRAREDLLLQQCVAEDRSFVVDNTNATVAQRAKYIALARANGYRVSGYYFAASATDAVRRNAERPAAQRVPVKAIFGTRHNLEIPSYAEGFERLFSVRAVEGGFVVEEWPAGQ